MFFFPIVLVVVLYVLLKDDGYMLSRRSSKSALELLDERLSRGEISIEEYKEIKSELT